MRIYVNEGRTLAIRPNQATWVSRLLFAIFGWHDRRRASADLLSDDLRRDIGLNRSRVRPGKRVR